MCRAGCSDDSASFLSHHSYPSRGSSARTRQSLEGASDHGVSEALYLRDPDSNGVELAWNRPKAVWPLTKDGHLEMDTRPLDTQQLLKQPTANRCNVWPVRQSHPA